MDEDLEQRILKKLYLWLIAGGIAIGGVGGTGVLRVDKFTRTDFDEELKKHMTFEILQHQALKAEILHAFEEENAKEERECNAYRQIIWERIVKLEIKQDNISNLQQGVLKELKERGLVQRK